jgi:hypothetical protein
MLCTYTMSRGVTLKPVRTSEKLASVPNKPKTPHRQVRLSDQDWQEFGQLADQAGTDRSAVIRQLVQWWLRRPGVTLPDRPAR